MSESKRYTNDNHGILVTHPKKKRKLSPNGNHHKNKHLKSHQNEYSNNNYCKYDQDLYETNKYLKRKIKSMQQTHGEQMLQLKQNNSSKIHKLESKAIKLSTNLKKLGKMYQNLQTEYDKLLEEHKNVLQSVKNNNKNKNMDNNNTICEETQYSLNELLQSLSPNENNNNMINNKHCKYIESESNDEQMTIIEYEEKKYEEKKLDNNKENEYEHTNTRDTQPFLLSNKVMYDHNNNNNKNHEINGVSLQWNEGSGDEFDKLEKNMHSNKNYKKYKAATNNNDNDNNGSMDGSPIKYVETVRGNKRNELPGHECIQCERFYALNNNHNNNNTNRKKLCNCVSRHRAKHNIPETPQHFWSIDFATQQ